MEPERKIEKWLRAYAKKRKGQAGGPFDLHPATRRLLHGEIARNTPNREQKDDETTSLWEVFRRDWAFLLGFALCIFFVAAVFFHSLTTSKKPEHTRSTYSADNQSIETLGELTNGPAQENALANKKDFGQLTNSAPETLAMNRSAAAPLPEAPPPATPAPSPTVAPPQPTQALSADLVPGNASMPPSREASSASVMQPAPAGAPEVAMNFQKEEPQKFAASRRLIHEPQNLFKNTSQAIPVLANFRVQQNGDSLRIVDQDGSVYDGSLQIDEGFALRSRTINEDKINEQNAVHQAAGGHVTPEKPQPIQHYLFTVSGTNRTLKQNVIFMGTFTASLAAAENLEKTPQMDGVKTDSFGPGSYGGIAGEPASQTQQAVTNQIPQLPWTNVRITGMAIINETNHVQINAKPMNPANH